MSQPRRVHGEGPTPCEIAIVGESPGWQEDRAGRPFVGKTGEELNRFLGHDKIPTRKDLYLTNLHREYRGKDYFYTAEDVAIDEQDLIRELQQVRPSLIVPLGRAATRWLLGDVDMDSVQGIAWHMPKKADGIPWINTRYDTVVVFPIIHPAAGFHNPEMAAYVVNGFAQLATYLDGKIEPRILFDDPFAGKEIYKLIQGDEVCHVLYNL